MREMQHGCSIVAVMRGADKWCVVRTAPFAGRPGDTEGIRVGRVPTCFLLLRRHCVNRAPRVLAAA